MKNCLAAVVLFCAATANAKPLAPRGGKEGPTGFPQMNPARIAEIAAMLEEKPTWHGDRPTASRADIDRHLVDPLPESCNVHFMDYWQHGDRGPYYRPMGAALRMIRSMTVAIMSDYRAAEAVKKLEQLYEWMIECRSWVCPAHDGGHGVFDGKWMRVDLGSSSHARDLACSLYYVGNRIDPAVKARILAEIKRRIFDSHHDTNRHCADYPSYNATHNNNWFFLCDNWNAVCHANVVDAALALVEDRADRAEFIEAAERAMPYFVSGFYEDGYCFEGVGYWNYGFGHYLRLAKTVQDATKGKLDLTRIPGARKAMEYALFYRLDMKGCPDFTDGGADAPDATALQLGLHFWPELRAEAEAKLPLRTAFPVAIVRISRSKDISFGLKGGWNQVPHGHHDVGSWTLRQNFIEVAGDPGGEVYTARTFSGRRFESDVLNSFGHPVPRVNGELQAEGLKYRGDIVSEEFSDRRDVYVMDLSKAYKATFNGEGRLLRTFTFERCPDRLSIRDEFTAVKPMKFDSPIITKLDYDPGFTAEATGGSWHIDRVDIPNPGRATVHRISVQFDRPVTNATVTWRYDAETSAMKGLVSCWSSALPASLASGKADFSVRECDGDRCAIMRTATAATLLPDGTSTMLLDNADTSRLLPELAELELSGAKWARSTARRVIEALRLRTGRDGLLGAGFHTRAAGEPGSPLLTARHLEGLVTYLSMLNGIPAPDVDVTMPSAPGSVGPWVVDLPSRGPWMVWHERFGLVYAGTRDRTLLDIAAKRQQTKQKNEPTPSVLRIEDFDGFSSVYDSSAVFGDSAVDDVVVHTVRGRLRAADGREGAEYELVCRVSREKVVFEAKADCAFRFHTPFIAKGIAVHDGGSLGPKEVHLVRDGVTMKIIADRSWRKLYGDRGEQDFTPAGGLLNARFYTESPAAGTIRVETALWQ